MKVGSLLLLLFHSFEGDCNRVRRIAFYRRVKEAKLNSSKFANPVRIASDFSSADQPLNLFSSQEGRPGSTEFIGSQDCAVLSSQQSSSAIPAQIQSELLEPSPPVVDVTANDPFAEYFSDSPDGQISVPDWITQKYFQPAAISSEESLESSADSNSSCQEEDSSRETPFLPFGELIGYRFPEEAAEALDLLFEKRCSTLESQAGPTYETCKHVLAECTVGSRTFRAFGKLVCVHFKTVK